MTRFLTIALVAILAGCGRGTPTAPSEPKLEPLKTYPITGIVREVQGDQGSIVLRHDEIPGFMPKMTMPFRVQDKDSLENINAGDKVSATLKVQGERFELENLTVEEPAEPPPLVLDLSGGEARLGQAPRKLQPGEEVPDFTMTSQTGESLRLSDLRGKVVVMTFIFTRCPRPDFCPRMDERFAELARKLSAVKGREDAVRLLSVSFDPEHDTPSVLAQHAKLRGARPPLWQFAVATHEELRKVVRQLGLTYGPIENEIIHNLSTAIIGPDGRLVELRGGSGWTPEDVYTTVRKVLGPDRGTNRP